MTGNKRWILVLVALAAATCLTIAVQVSTWWSLADVIRVQPTKTTSCFQAGDCMTSDLSFLGGGELWRRAGVATWTAGMIAALAVVALAGGLAAKRRSKTIAGVTLTSSMTAMVVGLVFVLRFPGMPWPSGMADGLPQPSADYGIGPVLYFLGAAVAAICGVLVLRPRPD